MDAWARKGSPAMVIWEDAVRSLDAEMMVDNGSRTCSVQLPPGPSVKKKRSGRREELHSFAEYQGNWQCHWVIITLLIQLTTDRPSDEQREEII